MSKRFSKFLVAIASMGCFLLVALYLSREWEWSLIDDTHFVLELQKSTATETMKAMYAHDVQGGLFRPGFWFYVGTFYLLPPHLAYLARLIMFFVAVGVPLMVLRRQGASALGILFTAALLLSNTAMYFGLSYPSLQEFTGLFLVACGLPFLFSISFVPVGVFFLLAATAFKSPFIWTVFALSFLWMTNKNTRLRGIISGTCALVLLIIIASWARSGSYTSRFDPFLLKNYFVTVHELIKPFSYVIVIPLLYIFVSKFKSLSRSSWTGEQKTAVAMICGGLLYLANLLPWAAAHYYFSGGIYLLMCGIAFFLVPHAKPSSRYALGLSIFLMISLFSSARGFWKVFSRNQSVVEIRNWLMTLPAGQMKIAINASEPTTRFAQITDIRSNGTWSAKFIESRFDSPDPSVDYLIQMKEGDPRLPSSVELVGELTWAKIYRYSNPNVME